MKSIIASLVLLAGLSATNLSNAESDRIIQFRGPMPYLSSDLHGREVELRFELYRSPERGLPIWTETRKVAVASNGWVRVDLGKIKPLPDEAFRSAFRFLSIWRGDLEFGPRKQIVSVAYAVSPELLEEGEASYFDSGVVRPGVTSAGDSGFVRVGDFEIEKQARPAATWLEAASQAEEAGASLPTFEEWYHALDSGGAKMGEMQGHYEWVLPWVYDPAVHSRMNELYRGKTIACYYDEISPAQLYTFRFVQRRPTPASPAP